MDLAIELKSMFFQFCTTELMLLAYVNTQEAHAIYIVLLQSYLTLAVKT